MRARNYGLVLLVVFCTTMTIVGTRCSQQPQELKIGVIAPLTGDGASYGTAMKQGIDMAIDELNAKGGIKGRKPQAIYEDDKLQPKDGVNAFSKLTSTDKVSVIIGSAASRVTMSIAPMAEQQKVVLISPISTADELKDAGDYIFRDVPPNSAQGKTAGQFVLQELKAKKIAVFYKNDDYGANLAKSFRSFVSSNGGTVVFDEGYDVDQKDYRSSLAKLKRTTPDVVFFPGNYQDNATILRQAKEAGISATFVGGDGAFSPELISLAGKAAEGACFTMMGLPKTPAVDSFTARFRRKYSTQDEPNVFALYSYDAMMVVAEAMKQGGFGATGIKDALYTVKYDGVTGPIKFDKYGEVDKAYSIYRVSGGKFELLSWSPK